MPILPPFVGNLEHDLRRLANPPESPVWAPQLESPFPASQLSEERRFLKRLLESPSTRLTDQFRAALEEWVQAAQEIEDQAVKVEADGSYILAKPEWFTATVANPVMRQVWLKPILKAATSLVTPSVCVSTPAVLTTPPADAKGTGQEKSGAGSDKTREELLAELKPADQKAYYAYAYAEMNLGRTTDPQAHQWLTDNGLPEERDSPELARELAGYKLPTLATWSKQVRNARKVLGEQKRSQRAGRVTGRSIIQGRELDHQGTDA